MDAKYGFIRDVSFSYKARNVKVVCELERLYWTQEDREGSFKKWSPQKCHTRDYRYYL